MGTGDAYENALRFYDCEVFETKPNKFYQLIYQNGLVLDTIERPTRIQAVQEFHRRFQHGLYNAIFVPTQSNCEVK